MRPGAGRRARPAHTRLPALESLEARNLLTGLPYGAVPEDTAEYMLGKVVATVVFFESDGSIDANKENWNPLVRDAQGNVVLDALGRTTSAAGPNYLEDTKSRIREGLQWWEDTLVNFYEQRYEGVEPVHSLDFILDFEYAHNPVRTGYEPISRTSNEYALWAADFLRAVGYRETGFIDTDIRAFNNAQRLKHDADWAFTIFVANDLNDPDDRFAIGGSFTQAFAFAGGRHIVSPAGRPASTFAHETGHIFYARDEYQGSGARYTDQRGYYDAQNWNAYDNPTPGFQQQISLMDNGADLDAAWAAHTSSDSSLAMIGWRDSDGDGVFDVLDVPLTLSGTGYYHPGTQRYHFTGYSEVQALVNTNSSGWGNDVTLNRVSRLVYSLDDGVSWLVARMYDEPAVTIDVSLPLPPGQEILLRTEALDPGTGRIVATSQHVHRGTAELPTSVPQPGAQGFVFDDRDRDGQWDVGERGVSGWTLRLVDEFDQPVQTARYLEPGDYAARTLLNNVLTGVTLTAMGSDVKDSRVGALDQEGQQVFGLVRNAYADLWVSQWTAQTRMLRIDFADPTTFVSLKAIGAGTAAYGRLEAYDEAGNLLGRATTGPLDEGQSETLALGVPTARISYVLARAAGMSSVMLDQLQVGPDHETRSGEFGQYTFPYLPPGEYRVQAVPGDVWDVASPSHAVAVVTVDDSGYLHWPAGTDRSSDFAGVPGPAASAWTNLAFAVDVNDDWLISPLDALLVITQLNAADGGLLEPADGETSVTRFVDVSGDGMLSPLDALLVITALNKASGSQGHAATPYPLLAWSDQVTAGGEAEGEGPRAPQVETGGVPQREDVSLSGIPVSYAAVDAPRRVERSRAAWIAESTETWETVLDWIAADVAGLEAVSEA